MIKASTSGLQPPIRPSIACAQALVFEFGLITQLLWHHQQSLTSKVTEPLHEWGHKTLLGSVYTLQGPQCPQKGRRPKSGSKIIK